MIAALRTAGWLGAERARAYGTLVSAASLCFGLASLWIYVASAIGDPHHLPLPNDFDAFWSGARLAAAGHAPAAYDASAIGAEEILQAQAASGGRVLPYMYPPVFLLLTLPFAWLAYVPALIAFALAGYASFVTILRRLLPAGWPLLTVVAFPGAIINAVVGQNGFISAGCFAGALLWLDRRPALAGACLGVFAFKPHLALCVPVALLAARRWRALAGCAAAGVGLVLASWAVLGASTWQAFAAALPATGLVLHLANVYGTGCSVYAAVLILGGGFGLAYAAQAAAAIAAAACVGAVAWRKPPATARLGQAASEIACLACAALLCTPYVMDYDLVCLAVPLAWLVRQGVSAGWQPWEKIVAILAYLLPLAARTLALGGVPVAPLVLAALLAVTVRRALAPGAV